MGKKEDIRRTRSGKGKIGAECEPVVYECLQFILFILPQSLSGSKGELSVNGSNQLVSIKAHWTIFSALSLIPLRVPSGTPSSRPP